ncbi:MBL fold metallo-hydrolase [Xanthomonas sp. 3058]|uniref:MBL fold metallo-hydrolase n=1 Tax=Xanthomonas sp. 3058 TaxID=3035314 RepID=UPI0016213DB7|nr:MBL fold metallo-hydrolase [Xanthomonas sp. 3058]MBB5865917.1 L-ascorbate metabolism protein UlaG (beta-lactamase superfamily) [Xanthomonas sp. 3058]
MSDAPRYLRANAVARPLLNHWILWDMLIPPVQSALVVAKQQLPILESYLRAPAQHAQAARDPVLMGGPWINYPTDKSTEIAQLLERTRAMQGDTLALAAALQALDDLLRRQATGQSLEALYAQIPAELAGLVELVYDLNDHPGLRLLEGLMYRSRFYRRDLQQFAFGLVERDWLPYERSTPVLESTETPVLSLPWDDTRLDALFCAEHTPVVVDELAELLGITAAQRPGFARLFDLAPPAQRHRPPVTGVRIRYLGHACLLIESDQVSILIDPFVAYEYPTDLPRYTLADLPERIDYVLITHGHSDHIRPEILLRLRNRIGSVVVPHSAGRRLQDPSLKLMLQALGFERVIELHEFERIALPDGAITALPFLGEHSDLDIQGKAGYHVQLKGCSTACLADSCNLDPALYRHIAAELGDIDALFLGMECEGSPLSWGYGHLLTRRIDPKLDRSRRDRGSHADEAIALIEAWPARSAYVYAMGQEPWLNHVLAINQSGEHLGLREADRFLAYCRARGIDGERLFAMKELTLSAG